VTAISVVEGTGEKMETTMAGNPRRLAPVGSMVVQQTKSEILRRWRIPSFLIFSLVMPLLLFALFGLPSKNDVQDGITGGRYLIASFGAYGLLGLMLFSFGAAVATERAQRVNVLMRATPLRPWIYFAAKVVTALLYAILNLTMLFGFALVAGDVRMSLGRWLALGASLLFGSIPFVAAGFAIGYLVSPTAAMPAVGVLNLVLAFGSGFFAPTDQLPHAVRRIAPYLPTNRYGQLAWHAAGARTDNSVASNLLWLLGYGVVFVAVALWAYWRDEEKTFG
jgi:ABC-2 type transport system permease protein